MREMSLLFRKGLSFFRFKLLVHNCLLSIKFVGDLQKYLAMQFIQVLKITKRATDCLSDLCKEKQFVLY